MVLYGFPFLYLLLTSFKTPIDTIAVPPSDPPRMDAGELHHRAGPQRSPAHRSSTASSTAVSAPLLSLVLAVPAAYGITRYQNPSGRVVHHRGAW